MIGILVKGTWLDLREGEEKRFYISKSLHDLRDLFGRNSDQTRSLVLPKTPLNIGVLTEHAPLRGDDYRVLPCEVSMNGITVLTNANLIVNFEDDNHFEVVIIGGAATFYNLLSEDPIKNLDFSSDNFTWDLTEYLTRVNSTSNVVTSWSQWFTNESYERYIDGGGDLTEEQLNATDIDKAGFSYYTKDILSKIFASTGLDIILDDVPDLYNTMAIVCPMTQIFDSHESSNNDLCEVSMDTFGIVPPPVYIRIPFNDVILNSGVWSVPDFWATPSAKGEYHINATVFKTGGIATDFFEVQLIKQLGSGVLTLIQLENCTNSAPAVFNQVIVVDPSEHVYLRIRGANDALGTMSSNSFFNFKSNFIVNREFNVVDWLPDISQKELVKNIFNLFHIVITEKSNKVFLSLFNKIQDNQELNLEKRAATDRQIKYSNRIPGHAQNNLFKYADEPLITTTSFNGAIHINNNALPNDVVRLELFFAGMDLSLFDLPGHTVPLYEMTYQKEDNNKIQIQGGVGTANYSTQESNDLKVNDIVFSELSGTTERFVVKTIIDNKNGIFEFAIPVNINDQDWSFVHYEKNNIKFQLANLVLDTSRLYRHFENSLFGDAPQIFYTNVLSWDFLIETFYSNYKAMIQKAQMLQIWVEIPNTLFLEINSTNPIYILGNKYYLNNTAQYKENGLTRLELIRFN